MLSLPSPDPLEVADDLDLNILVNYLKQPERTRPVVLLTVPPDERNPVVDIAEVARVADNKADVVIVPTARLTHHLADALGSAAAAYHGACRVYPPGTAWLANPSSVLPLFMARTARERTQLPDLLFREIRKQVRLAEQAASLTPSVTAQIRKPEQSAIQASPLVAKPGPTLAPLDTPPGEVVLVDTVEAAEVLVSRLTSVARTVPIVIVTRPTGAVEAFPDTRQLAKELLGLAEVFEITRPSVAWALSKGLPAGAQVYGGASRVYPPGDEWMSDLSGTRLHFAYSLTERSGTTQAILSDALSMASHAPSTTTESHVADTVEVTGTVQGSAAGSILVRLDDGQMGVIWPELFVDGVPPDRLLTKGMRVQGPLDRKSRRINISGMLQSPADALAGYRTGMTIQVRVYQVLSDQARVELFPGVIATVAGDDLVADTDLRMLLTSGEVLPALIVGRESQARNGGGLSDPATDEWLLSILEVTENPVPAASLITGGPPWLAVAKPATAEDAAPAPILADLDDGITDAPETLDDALEMIVGLRRELNQVSTTVRKVERDAKAAAAQLAELKTNYRQARKDLSAARRELGSVADRAPGSSGSGLFLEERDQLDFEIWVAWARRIPSPQKAELPLASWDYGPDFFETLNTTQGIEHDKVVDVLVEVLTGLADKIAARGVHRLRTGEGGDDAVRRSPDGGIYYRAYLQVNTPGARRLHYLKRPDGSIQFTSVRLHDDTRT